jgi:tRNA wybutosine-synthesizing protein 1
VSYLENIVPPALIAALRKQKYHKVGQHSAVKRCKWFHEALTTGRTCYKQKFYGINSHQCIQMSPTLYHCTQQCLFCWRAQNGDLQISWDELKIPKWDSPEEIAQGILKAQDRILTGYKAHPRTEPKKFREAQRPRHVAISLTGEPTLYGHLGELIRTLHARGLTTFLVTNGTLPQKLKDLNCEPTQLYVSVCAPNKEVFERICRPQVQGAWESLNTTLSMLSSFRCPTVIRSTLVRDKNMQRVDEYAKLVAKAAPTYVEIKAYMHVGFSGLRLGFDSMPSHEEIREFAQRLSDESGYKVLDESVDSRVVLLSKRKEPIRFGSG